MTPAKPVPLKGTYQAIACESILGYYDTEYEATQACIKYGLAESLRGSSRGTPWEIGEVIIVDTQVEIQRHQMSDGSGRTHNVEVTYTAVLTRTITSGTATYQYSSRPVFAGRAQGQSRA